MLEKLVEYCVFRTKENIDVLKTKYIVEKSGFALLVTDEMYRKRGTRSKRQALRMVAICHRHVSTSYGSACVCCFTYCRASESLFARFVHHTLEFYRYRRGSRPPSQFVVLLEQIPLCASVISSLRSGAWLQFMPDDTEWQRSHCCLFLNGGNIDGN